MGADQIFRLEPKVKGVGAFENEPANSTLEEMTQQQKFAETTSIWGTKKDIEKVFSVHIHTLISVVVVSTTSKRVKYESENTD